MRASLLLLPILLCGCQKDFDEQYAQTEQRLKQDAERIDKDMANQAQSEPGEAR